MQSNLLTHRYTVMGVVGALLVCILALVVTQKNGTTEIFLADTPDLNVNPTYPPVELTPVQPVVQDFSPHYLDVATCSPEVQNIIKKYNLNQMVAMCQSQAFTIDGKEVHLLSLVFGPGDDCMEGCIYNTYCAIVEDKVDYPYTFQFNTNNILGSNTDDWRIEDSSILTGRNHKITALSEFKTTVNEEKWSACAGLSLLEERQATVEATTELAFTPKNVPNFIKILQNEKEWEKRSRAAEALGMIGPEKGVVSALIQALGDEHYQVRLAVISALGELGPEVTGVVPALAQALTDEEMQVRNSAIAVLTEMGPQAVETVPNIINALDDEDITIRVYAAWALNRIGPGAAEMGAVPALIKALDDNWKVRGTAVRTLGAMGPKAEKAIPALINVLENDENAGIRTDAAWAIRAIKPNAIEAIPALIKAIENDGDWWWLQRAAIQTLRTIGPDAKDAVPALIEAIEDEDWQIREEAVVALKDITGQNFGADQSTWQAWWEENK